MKKKSLLLITASILAVLLVAVIVVSMMRTTSLSDEASQARAEADSLRLANEQLQLTNEFEAINAEFQQYESQAQRLTNDTIYAKYTAAKQKIEQLNREMTNLKKENNLSREKIRQLQGEINTLRGLLKHYIAQIDSLSKENAGLKAENQEIKNRNQELNSRVQEVSQRNEVLNERMTLAEKLNVTGVGLTALKKNGKTEKNVTKATQLMVSFTIPQNNSTPVGQKTIFLRLINPEGQLLGSGGSMSFEGGSVATTARKTVDYTGDELSGVRIYWDVNTTLTPGDYTVELFTDGYRLTKRHFTLQK